VKSLACEENGYLILLLGRVWSFLILHDRETLLGAWKASWRLLGVLGSSHTTHWVFSFIHGGFHPLEDGEEDGLQFGYEDANGRHNWSME